jgi:hypothetical protein
MVGVAVGVGSKNPIFAQENNRFRCYPRKRTLSVQNEMSALRIARVHGQCPLRRPANYYFFARLAESHRAGGPHERNRDRLRAASGARCSE